MRSRDSEWGSVRFVRNKAFVALFWLIAFIATIAACVVGARIGNNGDGKSGSHFFLAIFGLFLGGCISLAIFSLIWMALWASARRHDGPDTEEYDSFESLEDDFEEDDEPEESAYGDRDDHHEMHGLHRFGSDFDNDDDEEPTRGEPRTRAASPSAGDRVESPTSESPTSGQYVRNSRR